METQSRTLAKAATWQALGFAVTALVGWAWTGSWSAGGALATTLSAIGFATYALHERAWNRVRWGRRGSGGVGAP